MLQYFDTLTNLGGAPLLGAQLQVYTLAGGLANIYSANNLSSPIVNSIVSADITGQVSFYIPNGAYTFKYLYQGTVYKTRSPVTVNDLPYSIINVLEYGATGNGTTDDTVAINAALTVAATFLNANQVGIPGGSARVYLPTGNYKTSATLNRPAGVYLVGDGPECTSITASGNYAIIATTGTSSNVLNRGGVQDMCLNGTWGANNANTASIGISESWTNRSIHRDVRFHGCYIGMYGLALWQVTWDNLHADGLGTQQNNIGFFLDQLPTSFPSGTSNAVKAYSCVAQNTGTAGFQLKNPNGAFFTSCEAMNGVVGWDIGNTSSGCYPIQFLQCVNCTADTNSGNGWQIRQGSNAVPCNFIQLSNCWASTHGLFGFFLSGCTYVNISNPQSGNNGQGAVQFSQSTFCTCIGGEFQANNTGNNAGIGDIWLAGGGFHTIIGNNSNMANATSPSLLESNSTNNNIIANNYLQQSATLVGAATKAIGNQGYNPVGTSGPITVGASPATITAGQSPETHYLSQSATFTAVVTKGGAHTLGTLTSGTTLVVQLDPGGAYLVTWATTAPTYTRDIH